MTSRERALTHLAENLQKWMFKKVVAHAEAICLRRGDTVENMTPSDIDLALAEMVEGV